MKESTRRIYTRPSPETAVIAAVDHPNGDTDSDEREDSEGDRESGDLVHLVVAVPARGMSELRSRAREASPAKTSERIGWGGCG